MKELYLSKLEILWKAFFRNFSVALDQATASSNVLLL